MEGLRVRVIMVSRDGTESEHELAPKQWARVLKDHEIQSKHRELQRAYMRERRGTPDKSAKSDDTLVSLTAEARNMGILPALRAAKPRAGV